MPTATAAFHNRLAVIFDFDDTLAPDSYDTLLEHLGVDPDAFDRERVQPLEEAGWDGTLARFYRIVEEARGRDDVTLDQDFCRRVGETIEPFPGVPEMFDRVEGWAREVVGDVEVEFYLLSAGFADVHRHLSFADRFESIWGAEFHFEDGGEAAWCRQLITFSEKVRYVLQMAKGLGADGPNEPADVHREVPEDEWHLPLSQIIYVGDGASDMPVFDLLNDYGGMAIGLFKSSPEDWDAREAARRDRRVQNLAEADYSEGSELMRSLELAVRSIAHLIALRRLSLGE